MRRFSKEIEPKTSDYCELARPMASQQRTRVVIRDTECFLRMDRPRFFAMLCCGLHSSTRRVRTQMYAGVGRVEPSGSPISIPEIGAKRPSVCLHAIR